MKEYAFIKEPAEEPLRARGTHRVLKEITDKIDAVTVATHTEPWVVFVRCTEALEENEKALIEATIQSL